MDLRARSATMRRMGDRPKMLCDPKEIVPLMKQGDPEALDRLTRCYGERLLAYGRRHCASEEHARDAVQDALLAAGEHLEDFRGDGSVEGWLVRMVGRACSRMRRGRKNNPALHSDVADLQISVPDPNPEEQAFRAELAEALGEALLALPPLDRAVVLLTDAEGYKGPEVADALGLTHDAVRSRLARVRRKLREALDGVRAELEPA